MRIHAFEPIVGHDPKILILGSMPSVASLDIQEYYGFGRNQFWQIMGEIYGFDRDDPYMYRQMKIREHGIALWDVIESCERKGSLDANIVDASYNDVVGFIRMHPTIRKVILNGSKARDVYRRQFAFLLQDIESMALYSTSPANAISYKKKYRQWQAALMAVQGGAD